MNNEDYNNEDNLYISLIPNIGRLKILFTRLYLMINNKHLPMNKQQQLAKNTPTIAL